jgi:WD40 repeat protein
MAFGFSANIKKIDVTKDETQTFLELKGHLEHCGIKSLNIYKEKEVLISTCWDYTMRIWNVHNQESLYKIYNSLLQYRAPILCKNYLVSATWVRNDGIIIMYMDMDKAFDFKPSSSDEIRTKRFASPLSAINQNTDTSKMVAWEEKGLVLLLTRYSTLGKNDLYTFNVKTKEINCHRMAFDHTNPNIEINNITCVAIRNNFLVIGSSLGTKSLWDLEEKRCVWFHREGLLGQGKTLAVAITTNNIFCSMEAHFIQVWKKSFINDKKFFNFKKIKNSGTEIAENETGRKKLKRNAGSSSKD